MIPLSIIWILYLYYRSRVGRLDDFDIIITIYIFTFLPILSFSRETTAVLLVEYLDNKHIHQSSTKSTHENFLPVIPDNQMNRTIDVVVRKCDKYCIKLCDRKYLKEKIVLVLADNAVTIQTIWTKKLQNIYIYIYSY